MAMTKEKRKFIKRFAINNRSKPPKVFKWEITNEKGKILATIQSPCGEQALHAFKLGVMIGKYKSYKGTIGAIPKNEKIKKGEKK